MRITKMIKKRINRENKASKVTGWKFFENTESIAKYMVLHSKSINGKKWVSDKHEEVNVGYFKSTGNQFTARALIIGKHKFSLIVGV